MSKPIDSQKFGHGMAEAFNKWKESNKECFAAPVGEEYLSNRLWRAFMAGTDEAEVYLKKELAEYTKAYNQECERNDAIKKDLEYWEQRSADLLKFKQYVHDRLDKMGIPADPEPENNAAHGCRIEGRLNVVERLMGNNVA